MIGFENSEPGSGRAVAVVGDSLATVLGKPLGSLPSLTFDVQVQPAGSDIFSAGTGVAFATAMAATFSRSGYHELTATGANGDIIRIVIVCFGTNALNVPQIKYQDQGQSQQRSAKEARNILRALARQATKAGAQAALEGGAPVAPYWGTRPSTLGAASSDSLAQFGGW
jgi:hypothetical protein